MFDEIVKKFERFSDALILEFTYKNTPKISNGPDVEMMIRCMNAENNYKWQAVKLTFKQVMKIRFQEYKSSSTVVFAALLENKNGIIKIDFFPMIGVDPLVEDPNSDFYIHCKELAYEIIGDE